MSEFDDRYEKNYLHGKVEFFLSDYQVLPDQARYLLLKVVEQAVRDYIAFVDGKTPGEIAIWQSARDFIYSDDYRVRWGQLNLNLEEMLDMIDIDISWFREQTTRKFNNRETK